MATTDLSPPATTDPYPLLRPKRAPETRTFDLDGDAAPLTLTLRRASFATSARAEEEAALLIADYLEGSAERGGLIAPWPFPDIPASRTLIRVACLIRAMQAPGDGPPPYETMQLIRISEDQPNNWAAVMNWFAALASSLTDSLGNSAGGPRGS